jgi:hypothetical protein
VVAADLTKLKTGADGKLHVKIGLLPQVEGAVGDEFLGGGLDGEWLTLDPAVAPFGALPASVPVATGGAGSLTLTAPATTGGSLLLFLPDNDPRVGSSAVVTSSGAVFVVR